LKPIPDFDGGFLAKSRNYQNNPAGALRPIFLQFDGSFMIAAITFLGAIIQNTRYISYYDIYFIQKNMPAVSFYLPEDVLKALREEARARHTSVSRLIRTSVETQLDLEKRKRAKSDFLKAIRSAELGTWEEAHKERTRESDDRG
jgi:predicted transcriptional regulator